MARVIVPTGGAYEYDYGAGTTNGYSSGTLFSSDRRQIYRRVVERRIYADGTNLSSKMTYSVPETEGNTPMSIGYVFVEQRNASNTLLEKSKHYFHGPGGAPSLLNWLLPFDEPPATDGREYMTEAFDTNGTTVLRRIEQTWNEPNSSYFGQGPYVSQTVTTLEPRGANLVSKQTFTWDRYNNQTDVYEYDYGSGAAGSLVRRTVTGYVTTNNSYDYACDPSSTCSTSASISNVIHIRSIPAQVSLYDGGSTERARTTFEYDNYGLDSNHAGLYSRTSISGLDSAFSTSLTTRGNATGTSKYLLVNGSVTGSISGYAQYDLAGNIIKSIDARGNATNFYFTDCFGAPDSEAVTNSAPTELSTPGQYSYAFVTQVTNALNQSVFAQFDYYLGKPVNAKDTNGVVASGYNNDVLDRPTQVRRAVGVTGKENQTTFAYDDTNRTVTTTSDLSSNNDNTLKSQALYDQMGRTTESRQYEGGTNYIASKREYDAIGRAYRISNPYRPWNSESAAWTTNAYDALGRTVTTTSPDSAVVSTSYYGNTVTATDQASKSRKSVSDALGRLITVYEDPTSLNYSTSYTYDVLNNLTQVSQASQTRTFVYDSLKRLNSSTSPESGTATVDAYDNNGNMLVSTDARGVSTHVSYDELSRPIRRWYNGSSSTSSTTNNSPSLPSGVAGTDEVSYFYDAQTLPSGAPSFTRGYSTGALVAVTYGGGSNGTYRGYDELGRVVRQYQRTESVNYLVEAAYSVGTMTDETYPSVPGANDRRSVSFSYDSAGRLSSVSSSATTYAPAAGVSSIGYASSNALSTETYGNSLIHGISYNNRLQPTEIKVGTSSNSTSVLDLTYSYGTTSNNGNIQSVGYSGGGLSHTQSFTYDSLNRLSTATETNGGTSWSQSNAYDRYGNRQIDYGGGSYNLTFSSTTNRITTSGYSYDSAGNLTNDGSHSYAFDGDSKIKSVDSTTAYTYDGEGQRVKKLVGENTRFIYGIGSELIAEYDGSSGNLNKEYVSGSTVITIEPTAVNSNGTQYGSGDHLSSPRVISNSSAGVVSRHDYMPFGEELGAGTGGRTTGMGFSNSGDNNRKKFTGYERDTESGLDFAQARYYANLSGRFTSPDPFSGSAKLIDPQSFNRYSYVGNNPVNAVDPSGLTGYAPILGSGNFADDVGGMFRSHESHDEVGDAYAAYEQNLANTYEAIKEAKPLDEPQPSDPSLPNGTVVDPQDSGTNQLVFIDGAVGTNGTSPFDRITVYDPISELINSTDHGDRLLGYLLKSGFYQYVDSITESFDDNGKINFSFGRLKDLKGAVDFLEHSRVFKTGILGGLHSKELGENGAGSVLDARSIQGSKGLGPLSLQINIGKTTGLSRADLDEENPYQSVIKALKHAGRIIF